MTLYAILKESFIDDEYEAVIMDNECFTNKLTAYDKMLEEAQMTTDDWNRTPPSEFKLELFPKFHSCSICGEYEADYVNFYVIPMEVR